VRVVYVIVFRRDRALGGDAFFYHAGANLLVHGKGFIAPLQYLALHTRVEAADHPPLYMLFLSIPSALGLNSVLTHMLWSTCLDAATIAVAGLLGRRIAGNRAGLIAAALVAISPNVWVYDGTVLSETMAIFTATLALLMAYRAWERPTMRRLCALGATCGFAMLARSELVLLLPALLWPIALLADRAPWTTRMVRAGTATLVALAIVSPWVGYNLSRFHHPVLLSSQLEATLAGANCDKAYRGPTIGLFVCVVPYRHQVGDDESDDARTLRHIAVRYIDGHLNEVPAVVGARVARVAGLFHPSQQIDLDTLVEKRERPLAVTGLLVGYATELAAIAGILLLLRRRGPPAFPLVAMLGITLFTVATTYANDRFRATAETALLVAAAVALDTVRLPHSARHHPPIRPESP
jgi:4-amino-4-deoxy-L-arabinose transferase-like glycosyltransferase